jgi:Glycoside Hydrolase Family 113
MQPSYFQKYFSLFVIGAIALTIFIQGMLVLGERYITSIQDRASLAHRPTPTPGITVVPTQPPSYFARPNFEAGIVYPQWNQASYGPDDSAWQKALPVIQAQTGSRWLEMPVLFSQPAPTSTTIGEGVSTPTAESVVSGIRAARALGLHVFLAPLLGVDVQGAWAASIAFPNPAETQQWFDNFWKAFQPYVVAAQVAGAEQISIGTEEVWLQEQAPASLWNTLIERVRSIFTGTITYDENWTTMGDPIPSWFDNPDLGMIGVSEYIPIILDRERLDLPAMIPLWRDKVKTELDALSLAIKKPVFISEIGYRNSADTLYHPWFPDSTVSPPDPAEQAAACDAALTNVIPDPHIQGIYFWGWDAVGGFKLAGQPATAVLAKWYNSPQS